MWFLPILLCFTTLPQYGSCQDTIFPSLRSGEGNYHPDEDGKYRIQAERIRAYFVPYGASISNLFINDTRGIERDVVLGWDNATYYTEDRQHPYFGSVPGRYANRIKNSTFIINGHTYHTSANEHEGQDTLHGGRHGWSWRNWTVVSHTSDSVTFSLVDKDGDQGFPGEVVSNVTYSVSPYTWHIRMSAISLTKATPIMLTSHTYLNLDGFQNPSTALALNHTLRLPFSRQRVATDSILVPTGQIVTNKAYDVNDFWSQSADAPKKLGANLTTSGDPLYGNCGFNCTGYDTCYLVNRDETESSDWREDGPVASLASAWSGVQVDIYSDQGAIQVYSCNGQNGTIALKKTQGFFDDDSRPRVVQKYGCVVLEVEDWIDGINNPSWARKDKQIFGPDDEPYTLSADYVFTVDDRGSDSMQIEAGQAILDSMPT